LVTVEFVGRLLDGTIFESTNETGQAVTFRVNEVIPGWEEVLKLMNTGSHYSVWIPSELAYRNQGSGDKIRPNEVLHFEMHLASIE
jgi:FKBP-type peptidyl-prolyl cis-trans isomerase FklB